MNVKRSQFQIIGFLLSLAVVCYLMVDGPAASNAQEKSDVAIVVARVCDGREVDRDGRFDARTYIDNQQVTNYDTLAYSPGPHEVRVVALSPPGEEGKYVVREIKLLKGGGGEPTQRFTPNTAEATVYVDFPPTSATDRYLLYIAIDTCGAATKQQTKKFRVSAVSADQCEKVDWQTVYAVFDRDGRVDKFQVGERGQERQLEQGTYQVSVEAFPYIERELFEVVVFQDFQGAPPQVIQYPAQEGKARVNLEKGMWDGKLMPEIRLYIVGLCSGLEIGRVGTVSGVSWIERPDAKDLLKVQPGYLVRSGEIFKTTSTGSLVLELDNGYIVYVNPDTELKVSWAMRAAGRRLLENEIAAGKIKIERREVATPPKSNFASSPDTPGVSVKTPTATITDKETSYVVSFDKNRQVTTVGVEEGKVEVTPANSSLQPITLAANQQTQVTENNISPITAYTPEGGGKTGRTLLYIGVGLVGLLTLVALFFFFRRQHRLAWPHAFHPANVNPAGWNAPANVVPPVVNQSPPKCPNPRCGRQAFAGKKFCAHCGTRLNV